MDKIIRYFKNPGRQNTEETITAVSKRAEELNIKHIVVATRLGETALRVGEFFKDRDLHIVAIAHQFGYLKPGEWLIDDEIQRKLQELGVKVSTGTMPLTTPGRLYRPDWKGGSKYSIYHTVFPFDIIADTLRMFSQGMKVCVEIVVMAADMGLIPTEDEVISIAGTRRGADTAVVIKPAHIHEIYNLRILEIIAKPRLTHVFE
ncbi:MAG: hypothetical protein GTO35_07200 [Gammaproteobacteria bacterium]|nr:hypothetical protein [Gammaproteobacteria bacterium]